MRKRFAHSMGKSFFCEYNEPSADSCLHENLHSANVHHRAVRRDDAQSVRNRGVSLLDINIEKISCFLSKSIIKS